MRKLISIAILILIIFHVGMLDGSKHTFFQPAKVTLYFGFLLLAAYLSGELFAKLKMPKITGYIITGILLGPYIFGFIQTGIIEDLTLINELALTYIALVAGGELILSELKHRMRSILFLLLFTTLFVIIGVFGSTFLASSYIDFFSGMNYVTIAVICLILATISTARSPSSAIAIINETKASGPYTRTVLGVTVSLDVITIILFAIVISISEVLVNPAKSLDVNYILLLLFSIVSSIGIGVLIGLGISYYIEKVNLDLPILLLILAFIITRISHYFTDLFAHTFDVQFHLEPLLIAIAAGFYVENFAKKGKVFIESLEKSSLLIYVIFFAIAGVNLQIDVLKTAWRLGLFVFAVRASMLMISSYFAGVLSKDPPLFRKLTGIGLLTQAGVSIGLANEVVRRFPTWGTEIATIVIAVITINQIIGPIAFKYALNKIGETNKSKY